MLIAKQSIIIFVIACIIVIPFGFAEEAPKYESEEKAEVGEMVYDAMLMRPFGTAATVIGMGFFIVSLPFSAAFEGGIRTVFHRMVVEPAVFTFKRPLGKF